MPRSALPYHCGCTHVALAVNLVAGLSQLAIGCAHAAAQRDALTVMHHMPLDLHGSNRLCELDVSSCICWQYF